MCVAESWWTTHGLRPYNPIPSMQYECHINAIRLPPFLQYDCHINAIRLPHQAPLRTSVYDMAAPRVCRVSEDDATDEEEQ